MAFLNLTAALPTRRDDFWKYIPLKILSENNDPSYPPPQQDLFGQSVGDNQTAAAIWAKACQHIPDAILKKWMQSTFEGAALHALRGPNLKKLDISNAYASQTQIVLVEESCEIAIESIAQSTVDAKSRLKNLIFVISPKARVEVMWKSLCKSDDVELTQVQFFMKKDSHVDFFIVAHGGRIQKSFIQFIHEESGSSSNLRSLAICQDQSVIDHHTFVHHIVGDCSTSHVEKSIVSDHARFIFHGRVRIEQGAQKAACSQLNHNLIEHDTAEVDSTPQLEILADDVKATHGFALGEIQEEEVFYLRTRGIPERIAKKMLKAAYARDLTEKIASPKLRAIANNLIQELMGQHDG